MKDLIQFEGGEILANLDDRTITGLLLPYNEIGQTNIGRFMVEAGAILLPADPSIIGINVDHERSQPVGRATRVWEEPAGIMATFAIAATPEGDAALADATAPDGKRKRLSAEFHTVIKAGKALAGKGRLWGAATVALGAFPSAMVLAADTPDAESFDEGGITNAEHVNVAVDVLPKDITATTTAGDTAIYTPEAAPAEVNPEGASTVTASIIPTTLLPAAPLTVTERAPDARQVYAAIAALKSNRSDDVAREVLAALKDIKISGAGALPGAGVIQTNWLGLLNQGVPYVREYIGLGKLGTDITAGGKKGFKIKRGTAAAPLDKFDGEWAGNKTEAKSYNGFSTTHESTRRNFMIAEDVAREFYDLPGGAEVVEAFLALIVEDHARWSDESALADLIAIAGPPIAPSVYPGVDGHDYAGAMGQVIQGILAVKRRKADGRRDVPTFAIANDLAYEELLYTPKDLIPEFITFDVNTDGTGTADGKVHIVQGDTNIEDSSSVIVGANYAIEFDELAGGPLHIDALDLARGGIDKAVAGYLQTFNVRPEAVVHIGTADA